MRHLRWPARAARFRPRSRRSRVLASIVVLSFALLAARWLVPLIAGAPVVVLDPGHGGDEPGAEAAGLVERDSNLDLALRIQRLLERDGVRVVLTRTGPERPAGPRDASALSGYSATWVDLQNRVAIANRAHADVFVSLHSNQWSDESARGAEAWYDPDRPFADQSRGLAASVQAGLAAALSARGYDGPIREPQRDTDLTDAIGRRSPLLVLGPSREVSRAEIEERGGDPAALGLRPGEPGLTTVATEMPGVLLELLYFSAPADRALLTDEAGRDALARGVAAGIARHLGLTPARE